MKNLTQKTIENVTRVFNTTVVNDYVLRNINIIHFVDCDAYSYNYKDFGKATVVSAKLFKTQQEAFEAAKKTK